MSLENLFNQLDNFWHLYSAAHNDSNRSFHTLESLKFEIAKILVELRTKEELAIQETYIRILIEDKVPLGDAVKTLKKEYVYEVRKNNTLKDAMKLLGICRKTIERIIKGRR